MASGKVSQRVIGQGSHNVWKSQGQSGKAVILASVDTASAPLVTFKLKHQGLVKKFEFNMQQFQHQTFNITKNPPTSSPKHAPTSSNTAWSLFIFTCGKYHITSKYYFRWPLSILITFKSKLKLLPFSLPHLHPTQPDPQLLQWHSRF